MTDRSVGGPDDDGRRAAESADGGTEDRDAEDRAPTEREWTRRVWYRSRVGLAVIGVDLLLTVLLVAGTVVAYEVPFAELNRIADGVVPSYVYAFSLFGALGFVFTALIDEFDSSAGDLLRYNFRLPAALPLGVGIYLLSGVILGEGTSDFPLVAGTVFLAGLYVNLAYKRLGALARRLLPGRREEADA
ncbi:hypothetical protein CK500_08635 [Halorubrum salipaludis]|uniref:Uncharacterized protein n=1 Tax=Halorubrum salipaludis TaxID=2032630 RepID=A0A2A2FFZ8_9EURY|nr:MULTISPECIES: hypothetical protein [Halorubrum]PAU83572.1 hypothetical protein CK500_08635 [Halorubrum salipaludis]